MSFLRDKRIKTDIKNFIRSDLESNGIFCKFSETDMTHVRAMIIGPSDTPYENGFYFFDLRFPDNYPWSPPKVKFITQDSNIRFNPNLYVDGKVCLSILGTWNGPEWSSCLTLNSILLSIQTLLNENPLQNEPGFENENGHRSKKYNIIIEYFNIKGATLKMIKNTPNTFEHFIPIMEEHFFKNIGYYRKYIEDNLKNDRVVAHSPIYNLNTVLYIKKMVEDIDTLYKKIEPRFKENEKIIISNNETQIPEIKEIIIEKKLLGKRKCPDEPSKLYEIGTIKFSVNDKRNYKVVQVSGPKRTMKRWVLSK